MTFWLLLTHLLHYTSPIRQRYIIRILLMVPIYAIDSYWCYIFYHEATWISIARDTYEAYVLYNFFALLMDYVGGEDGCVAAWAQEHAMKQTHTESSKNASTTTGKHQKRIADAGVPTMPHSFPMNYILAPMKLNPSTLWWWKASLVLGPQPVGDVGFVRVCGRGILDELLFLQRRTFVSDDSQDREADRLHGLILPVLIHMIFCTMFHQLRSLFRSSL